MKVLPGGCSDDVFAHKDVQTFGSQAGMKKHTKGYGFVFYLGPLVWYSLSPPEFPEAPEVPDGEPGFPEASKVPDGEPGFPEAPKVPDGEPGFPGAPKVPDGEPRFPGVPETPDGELEFPGVP